MRAPEPVHIVFVYGTLQHGNRLHVHLAASPFVGRAHAEGLRMLDLGPFPAVVRGGPSHVAHGEAFAVSADVLRRLDVVEGVPTLYRHETCTAVLDCGRTLPAWVYIMAREPRGARPVPSGRWAPPAPWKPSRPS